MINCEVEEDGSKKKKTSYESLRQEVLLQEVRKLKAETEKLKEETKKIKIEGEVLVSKKELYNYKILHYKLSIDAQTKMPESWMVWTIIWNLVMQSKLP